MSKFRNLEELTLMELAIIGAFLKEFDCTLNNVFNICYEDLGIRISLTGHNNNRKAVNNNSVWVPLDDKTKKYGKPEIWASHTEGYGTTGYGNNLGRYTRPGIYIQEFDQSVISEPIRAQEIQAEIQEAHAKAMLDYINHVSESLYIDRMQ